MLRKLLNRFKREDTPQDTKEKKKKIIKEYVAKTGISWSDIENVLFWKDPRVSLAIFIIVTGFFWKFISYKLQRLGLIIIAAAVPCSFPETRTYITQYCTEKLNLDLKPERRTLGVNDDDIYEFLADSWLKLEEHYIYLIQLKHTSNVKFYLFILSFFTFLLIIANCLPLAGMTYLCGTLLYFCPILSYLDLFNAFLRHVDKLTRPVITHWIFSQTKRRRNRLRKPVTDRYNKHSASLSDIETEEFIPSLNKDSKTILAESTIERKISSDNSLDEFQLRGDFVRQADDFSSGDEEESFLPSYSYQVPDEIPSLSAFNSMTEPVEDDFQRDLDFNSITMASNMDSNFGLPDNYVDEEEVTSEDIDDIPFEDEGNRKFSNENHFGDRPDENKQKQSEVLMVHYENSDSDSAEFDVDHEFEFLDSADLYNVTDEEINEQNVGAHSHSQDVASNSNVLGY